VIIKHQKEAVLISKNIVYPVKNQCIVLIKLNNSFKKIHTEFETKQLKKI